MRDRAAKRSLEYFESGFWCAESVLLAIAETQGIESDLIPRIATGFCSGMARTGGQCGALSAAIMGISLVTGRNSATDPVDETYARVSRVRRMFEEEHGATGCSALLGVDLATEEGQRAFEENNLVERCRVYTEDAARMAIDVLEE